MKLPLAAGLFINRSPCFGPTTHKKSDLFAVFGRSGAHQQPLRQPTRSHRGWIRGWGSGLRAAFAEPKPQLSASRHSGHWRSETHQAVGRAR